MQKRNLFLKTFIISFFLCFISLPLLFELTLSRYHSNNSEKRNLSRKPQLRYSLDSIRTYPKAFEAYFNDHFRLRTLLLRAHHWLWIKVLHLSPSRKVVLGKDGWIYYRDAVSYYRSARRFSPKELESWRRYLERRRDWLTQRNMAYIFVVAPNKATIYPEHIPEKFNKVHVDSLLDQLIQYIGKVSRIRIVDLREALIKGKNRFPLYYSTDTHWNQIGGFFAYQRIMAEIGRTDPRFEPIALTQFRVTRTGKLYGDLARMIGGRYVPRERKILITPKFKRYARRYTLDHYANRSWPATWQAPFKMACGTGSSKIVAVGDSFLMGRKTPLPLLLGEHFRVSIFLNRGLVDFSQLMRIVEKEKPNFVLEEIIERSLAAVPKEISVSP